MNNTINITNTTELKKIVADLAKKKPEDFASLTFKFVVSFSDSIDMSRLYHDIFWYQKRSGSHHSILTVIDRNIVMNTYLVELKGSHRDVYRFLKSWLIFLLKQGNDNENETN